MSTKKKPAPKPAAKAKPAKPAKAAKPAAKKDAKAEKPVAKKDAKSAKAAKPVAKAEKPVAKAAKPAAKAAKPAAKAEKPAAKAAKPAAKAEKPAAKAEKPAKKKAADKAVEPVEEPVADVAEKTAKQDKAKKKKKGRKVAEQEVLEPNKHLDFVFSIAEAMKKALREENEANDARTTPVKLSRRPDTRVKGKNTQKFPAADLAQFKKTLLMMRQTALGQSASLRDIALEQTEERGGEDEDGSDAFLRLQNLSQVDSQNRIVRQIDEAMARIANGTYGVCENCGQLIRKPRLLNLPFVRTCMECQMHLEQR